jgi:hypothetical protein
MSHFACMVIGPNIETQLAPYHEFECTGIDDEYVVDVDETADYQKEYDEGKRTMLRRADGSLHNPYADEFKVVDPNAKLFDRQKYEYPPDGELVEVPYRELWPAHVPRVSRGVARSQSDARASKREHQHCNRLGGA